MTSEELFDAALRVIPGGVNSPVRAFGSVGGVPRFIARASGARITAVDGKEYIDYVGSWGVMLLGHDHPAIRAATLAALERGASFGAPTAAEVDLARRIASMVPSIEQVRLVNSGTEATMSALRLARGATGKAAVIKFRGGYHGHGDAFLVEAGSGAATFGVPSSLGVTASSVADTLVAEYNDLGSVARCFAARPDDVACVFVEPVAGNMGCVPPADGFLEGLRGFCDEAGALLVFDEVMTGFRVAAGGAQGLYGVRPDLTTLGKIVGGGLPIGAYGGSEALMSQVAPSGRVYQAGTLSGNPLATAAGLATLEAIQADPSLYAQLDTLARRLGAGLVDAAHESGIEASWNSVGSMGSLFFSPGPVTGWTSAADADAGRYARYFHHMLEEGIYLAPSPFEAMFVSTAHSEADIDRTIDAAVIACGRLAREGAS